MFRFARVFGDAGIIQNLHGGRRTEVFPILQDPDDFLVPGDFDELRALAVAAAGTDDRVAVGQPGAGLRVDEAVFRRQVVGLEFPDGFALRIDFAREVVLFVGDQGVAVLEADGGPRESMLYLQISLKSLSYSTTWSHAEKGTR